MSVDAVLPWVQTVVASAVYAIGTIAEGKRHIIRRDTIIYIRHFILEIFS